LARKRKGKIKPHQKRRSSRDHIENVKKKAINLNPKKKAKDQAVLMSKDRRKYNYQKKKNLRCILNRMKKKSHF